VQAPRAAAVATLRTEKDAIAEAVLTEVTDTVGDVRVQLIEEEAKEFVDAVGDGLASQGGGFGRSGDREVDGYAIAILDEDGEIEYLQASTQAGASGDLATYLITEHDRLEHIDIPYPVGSGSGTRALLDDDPRHRDGKEMKQAKELPGGHHLLTNMNAEQKRTYVPEVAAAVGLTCRFEGEWTD